MTAKDLIKELNKADPDSTIVCREYNLTRYLPVHWLHTNPSKGKPEFVLMPRDPSEKEMAEIASRHLSFLYYANILSGKNKFLKDIISTAKKIAKDY